MTSNANSQREWKRFWLARCNFGCCEQPAIKCSYIWTPCPAHLTVRLQFTADVRQGSKKTARCKCSSYSRGMTIFITSLYHSNDSAIHADCNKNGAEVVCWRTKKRKSYTVSRETRAQCPSQSGEGRDSASSGQILGQIRADPQPDPGRSSASSGKIYSQIRQNFSRGWEQEECQLSWMLWGLHAPLELISNHHGDSQVGMISSQTGILTDRCIWTGPMKGKRLVCSPLPSSPVSLCPPLSFSTPPSPPPSL